MTILHQHLRATPNDDIVELVFTHPREAEQLYAALGEAAFAGAVRTIPAADWIAYPLRGQKEAQTVGTFMVKAPNATRVIAAWVGASPAPVPGPVPDPTPVPPASVQLVGYAPTYAWAKVSNILQLPAMLVARGLNLLTIEFGGRSADFPNSYLNDDAKLAELVVACAGAGTTLEVIFANGNSDWLRSKPDHGAVLNSLERVIAACAQAWDNILLQPVTEPWASENDNYPDARNLIAEIEARAAALAPHGRMIWNEGRGRQRPAWASWTERHEEHTGEVYTGQNRLLTTDTGTILSAIHTDGTRGNQVRYDVLAAAARAQLRAGGNWSFYNFHTSIDVRSMDTIAAVKAGG